jgi:hypothetical protein
MSAETLTNQSRLVSRFSSLRDLSVTYEGYSEDIATRPPDISTRGMFLNTTRSFPEGAVLSVRFKLAHSGIEISTRAEVRYCLPGVGVGVEFQGITPQAMKAIEEEINLSPERDLRKGVSSSNVKPSKP